jgi:LysM repeat protein
VKYFHKTALIFALAAILSSGMAAADEMIHVVGKGETIYSISRFYRITADELMKTNGISDPSTLQVGKKLKIPSSAFSDISVSPQAPVITPAPASAAAPAQQLVDYRVVKGDTLFGIAKNHGITLNKLQEINKFSSNHVIKAGDIVKVPGKSAPAGSASQANTAKTSPAVTNSGAPSSNNGLLSMRWPVTPKEISYMTGQMGIVVEGEHFEAVKSLTQGRVISAGPWRKFGKVAIVEVSGGYFYMYGGCESLSVNVGDRISVGTELGKLGINALSEKPQLFFMVFRNDVPIDPAKAPRASGNART